jgi:hypothetical protein
VGRPLGLRARRPSNDLGEVALIHLCQEDLERPQIRCDVVGHHKQDGLLPSPMHEHEPDHRPRGQVKRAVNLALLRRFECIR